MSEPSTDIDNNKDTPTHRYDLMEMRVNEIQGLVAILQHRRTLIISKAKKIREHSAISQAKTTDAALMKVMNRLEKLIERMKKDDESITKLLNESRGLLFEASDGTLRLEKTDGLTQS